jgi:hypothetical protein
MRLREGLAWFRRRSNLQQTAAVLLAVATIFTATREVIKAAGGTVDSVGGIVGGGDKSKAPAVRTPDDPQAFAAYFVRLFFSEPSRYWELLNPAEKKAVSETAYLKCLDPPTGLVSAKPFDIYRGPIAHGPWAKDGTQVTKVTLKTKLRTPDNKLHVDEPSVLLVREKGHWTGLLKDYEYTALKNHRCPAYRTIAEGQEHAGTDRPGHRPAASKRRTTDASGNGFGGGNQEQAGTDAPGRTPAAGPPPQSTDGPGKNTAASGEPEPGHAIKRKTLPVRGR